MKTTLTITLGLAALLCALPGSAAAQSAEEDAELLAAPAADSGMGLKLSGFADFRYVKFYDNGDPRWQKRGIPKYGAFSVGNLNLYLESWLDQQFRSLIEVRFSYLPNGVALQGSTDLSDGTGLYTGTRTYDYAQLRAKEQWGGVIIERAWLEYHQSQALTIRGGQLLTPYGIWNVDHGSPTLIDSAPPYVIGQELFPKSQVGVEAYGSAFLADARFGYNLTASNGRIGDNPQFMDFDNNFAFGGRGFVEAGWVGALKLGASGYLGKFTERRQGLDFTRTTATGPLPLFLPRDSTTRADERCWGVDLRWDLGHFTVLGEYMQQRLSHQSRDSVDPLTGLTAHVTQGVFTKKGGYLLTGYRLPGAVMPFVSFQYVNDSRGDWLNDPKQRAFSATSGLNWRVRPNVVAKLSYTYSWWPNTDPSLQNKDPLKWVSTQVAWAF